MKSKTEICKLLQADCSQAILNRNATAKLCKRWNIDFYIPYEIVCIEGLEQNQIT